MVSDCNVSKRPLKVLIACEESQTVCKAFRALGHEAYSCDVQECSGGHPEWHIHDDVIFHLNEGWDMMIAHPPCTYLSAMGMNWQNRIPGRKEKSAEAMQFVLKLWEAPVPKIAIENPIGLLNTWWRKPSQIIEPYYFGDREKKATCLWLKGLPRLNGNPEVLFNPDLRPVPNGYRKNGRGKYFMEMTRDPKLRSKTFPGIARAMAEQWAYSPTLTKIKSRC